MCQPKSQVYRGGRGSFNLYGNREPPFLFDIPSKYIDSVPFGSVRVWFGLVWYRFRASFLRRSRRAVSLLLSGARSERKQLPESTPNVLELQKLLLLGRLIVSLLD